MTLRVARHTNQIELIVNFYTNLLGLKILGEFKDHNNYDGVFLGNQGADWHLEFTTSTDLAEHHPDEDDLLVFYVQSVEEYNRLQCGFKNAEVSPVPPKNPYWKENGTTYIDPDGFRVVISIAKE